ncbi:hypothetical protein OIU78_025612 [Salix suchowensis]|nr:hypothetical protein OIU78_025612 [Salix suchowensis]
MDDSWSLAALLGFPHPGIPGEEDQVGPCEQLDALSSFNPLAKCGKRKENPWTDPHRLHPRRNYEIAPRTPSASVGSRTDHRTPVQ